MSDTKPHLDLSLYLVTDSTPDILGDKDLCHVVEEAIKGGVTVVQYRDKHADTGQLITTAKRLHVITKRYGVPLLINDRLDVCLAAGTEGVHIGQEDVKIEDAKRALPANAIIGMTASSVDEAEAAINGGADYLGIGTMFATPTKKDTKSIIGTRGTQEILSRCQTGTQHSVGCVAIGSINATNVQRVLHQSTARGNRLNGVAVVSAIVAASNPKDAATELAKLVKSAYDTFYVSTPPNVQAATTTDTILRQIPAIIEKHVASSVLSHNMTNTVVQNFAANVCLATGASPIMSTNGAEAPDLAKLGGGLVINMGTITPDIMNAYQAGVRAYNAVGNPVLLDPVGGGATMVRRTAIQTLLRAGFYDVIKGNEGEIGAVLGTSATQQRGVDSGPSTSDVQAKATMVKLLAQRERCIVLMTGATDFLSDGERTLAISNGSSLLGKVTGSGCALGSVIVSYLALQKGTDKLVAALAGILHYELAAERAAKQSSCRGPGSFIPTFLDELYLLGQDVKNLDLLANAEVELV
ncbi:thiamine biosynthetic bifunctional enzyme [Lithohypha guttulata]|uniref:Thiamine biosynthetic bifunctional enzyme n=1 Tax=Lithohypha guttulata TaxID=1690604 RepID=A0AAN7SX57_9EURO|nr:thiamine biosynthetic bifunctional enzyme [Lithohypha guttulata]KAK5083858.1 thiamine biosynthetic bifunctional enzyme [Lithohypha guttulata]